MSTNFRQILGVVTFIAIVASSFLYHFDSEFFWEFQYQPLTFQLAVFIGCFILLAFVGNKTYLVISRLDLFVTAYIVYAVTLNQIRFQNWEHNNESYLLLAYYGFYLFIKQVPLKSEYIYCILISFGLINMVIAVSQALRQSGFIFTGAFENSSSLACYLAALIPLLIALSKKYPWFKKIIYILISIFIVGIITSGSRAAILSIIFIFGIRYAIVTIKQVRKKASKNIILITSFFALSIITTMLYFIRPTSVIGKLLIWKVGLSMVKVSPIFGSAGGFVKSHYNVFQADYFQIHGGTVLEKYLSSEVYFVFNEFLRLIIEYGFIGLLLFLSMIYYALKPSLKVNSDCHVFYPSLSIIIILLFGLFSYTLSSIQINSILFVCLALISRDGEGVTIKLLGFSNFCVKAIMMLLILIPTYKIAQTLKAIVDWKSAQLLWSFNEASAIETYRNIQPVLVNNPSFLFNYGVQLMNMRMYEKAYPILKLSTQRLNSIATFTQLGLCARELNIANEPEQYYLRATYIVPSRLIPKLDLLNFYIFNQNRLKAEIIAGEILSTPVKIPSAEAATIKLVAQKYLMDRR